MAEKQVVARHKKVLQGTVVSDKMDKTIVVLVERIYQHPLYKRIIKKSKRYKVHDEKNSCHTGDHIRLIECKPISRHKNWRLLEITEKAI